MRWEGMGRERKSGGGTAGGGGGGGGTWDVMRRKKEKNQVGWFAFSVSLPFSCLSDLPPLGISGSFLIASVSL